MKENKWEVACGVKNMSPEQVVIGFHFMGECRDFFFKKWVEGSGLSHKEIREVIKNEYRPSPLPDDPGFFKKNVRKLIFFLCKHA